MSMNEVCFDCRYNFGGKSFSEVIFTKYLLVLIDVVVIYNVLCIIIVFIDIDKCFVDVILLKFFLLELYL